MSEEYLVCVSFERFRAMTPAAREMLVASLLPLGIAVPPETVRTWLGSSDVHEGFEDICFPVTFEQAQAIKALLRGLGVGAKLRKIAATSP